MEDLNAALAQAWSLSPEAESGGTYIGSVERGERVFQLYKDNAGQYTYKTMFKSPRGLITEEEHIFGRKPPKTGRKHS